MSEILQPRWVKERALAFDHAGRESEAGDYAL